MGVPTSEAGYTIATTRRETTKVHKNMWWHWGENIFIYIYLKTSKLCEMFFLTSFLVLKMSPSTFFARFCLFLLKYLSFMLAGNFTPEISNFVLVAIKKFWLMRRRGHALILKGPGSGKEKHCKYFTVNVYRRCRWQYNLFEHFSTYNKQFPIPYNLYFTACFTHFYLPCSGPYLLHGAESFLRS